MSKSGETYKMEEGTKQLIIILIGILLFTGILTGGIYYYRKLNVDNFQVTIKELTDEQKCLHICGFEFHNYMENYKFCLEKCDRISERQMKGGNK